MKNLPDVYTFQKKAWVAMEDFIDWYNKIFIPRVKENKRNMKKSGRLLLTLDNDLSHSCVNECENGKFLVLFMPLNVTPIIQPMVGWLCL